MVRKPTRQGKTAILTFPGEDGAAAAALLLASNPLAEVLLSSKNAIAGVLGKLAGRSLKMLDICGVGIPYQSLEGVVQALQTMKRNHVKVAWHCGAGYLDEFRPALEPWCECRFEDDGLSMPEMLFQAMNKEGNLPARANLIRLVGTKYASREDVPAKDRSLWDEAEPLKTLVQAAVRRWLNFGDEAIFPHAVRVVAGLEAMNLQDRKLILLFKQYHRAYLMGHSKAIKEIRGLIQKCGPLDIPVLITGETGTGKEIVARLIHEASRRAEGLFAAVNCANLEGTLLQDRLFGHVKGAYSGADRDKPGLFESANGGTLFLDEIGEMPLETQAQLLRVLQDGEFYRLGEEKARATDVRIVAATNRDLMAEVAQGKFREDLYYRLAVIPIALPPLRERPMDIPTLAGHILHQFCRDQELPKLELPRGQLDVLKRHHWPGNVRELENVLQRMVALGEKNVAKLILPGSPSRQGPAKIVPLKEFEQQYVREVYDRLERNIARTAQALGISRNTLKGKLKPG